MAKIGIMIEGQEGLNWERWRRICHDADTLGFDSLRRSDHLISLMNSPDRDCIECWISLALAAEYRDDATGQHTQRVGELAALLGRSLGFPDQHVELIRTRSLYHGRGRRPDPRHPRHARRAARVPATPGRPGRQRQERRPVVGRRKRFPVSWVSDRHEQDPIQTRNCTNRFRDMQMAVVDGIEGAPEDACAHRI